MHLTQTIIDNAAANSVISLANGSTVDPIVITKPLDIECGLGTITVNGTIRYGTDQADGPQGGRFRGVFPTYAWPYGTKLNWGGNKTDPMFQLCRSQWCILSDFSIACAPWNPLHTGIATLSSATGQVSNHHVFERVLIDGTDVGGLQYAVFIGKLGVWNGNNDDMHQIRNCSFANYSKVGVAIGQPEAKHIQLYDVTLSGNGNADAGISTANNDTWGGSFWARNVSGGGHKVADIVLGSPDDCLMFDGGNFESSHRLLSCVGQTSAGWPVLLRSIRWSGNNLASDGRAISYTHRGALTVEACIFECQNQNLKLFMDVSGKAAAVAIGNEFLSCPIANNPLQFSSSTFGHWVSLGNTKDGVPIANVI